ncbi:hypothetical protein PPM_3915 [Paenibacillus polymyxa M1]|nr:hypothetical protein PPM_3915 [Paenibacillus polymyxa M1]
MHLPLVILHIFLQRFIVGGAMAGAVKSLFLKGRYRV